MSFAQQPLLVTGGAGFIGSSVVRQWIAEETVPVINLDKLTYAGHLSSLGAAQSNPKHTFVQGDIADLDLLHDLFTQQRPRAVMHLAAETHVDRSIDGPAEFFETNIRGTFNLLEAACRYWRGLEGEERDSFRLLHVSTDEVFGVAHGDDEFRETTPYSPNSPYAASKAAADHLVRAYQRTYGLPILITNCSNNYGPCQTPEKLIPLVIKHALTGKPIPIYGDGQQVRDWLYVEDHARALRLVLSTGVIGETYLVGSGHRPPNIELVLEICSLVDELRPGLPHGPCKSLLTHVADRPGHDRRYAVDSSKLRRDLGWKPQVDFAAGIRQTVQWYLANQAWVDEASAALPSARIGLGTARK